MLHYIGLNKKQNVSIDSPASSRGKGKYMTYVSFPLPALEAVLSIFNVIFFVKKLFFEKELIKTKEIAINAES